jgi:hypothetical protein
LFNDLFYDKHFIMKTIWIHILMLRNSLCILINFLSFIRKIGFWLMSECMATTLSSSFLISFPETQYEIHASRFLFRSDGIYFWCYTTFIWNVIISYYIELQVCMYVWLHTYIHYIPSILNYSKWPYDME